MENNNGTEVRKGNTIFSGLRITPKKSSVIKNQEIKIGSPQQIQPAAHESKKHGKSNILPIKKNGEIIGFINECSCGEVVKVYFDFGEN